MATRRGNGNIVRSLSGFVSVVLVLVYVIQRVYWLDVLAIFVAGAVARGVVDRLRFRSAMLDRR